MLNNFQIEIKNLKQILDLNNDDLSHLYAHYALYKYCSSWKMFISTNAKNDI